MDASDRRKRIETEATEWWLVLQGQPSRGDREGFVDWLRESSLHVAEMLRIAQLHGALEQFDRWAQLPADGRQDPEDPVIALLGSRVNPTGPRQASPGKPRRALRTLGLIAAVLLVAFALGTIVVVHSRGQIIQTDRGERRDVSLADGSVVDLDPETRVRVQYETAARYIFLERGRALFHVAKNPNRPFWVEAEHTRVRAVGTAFAVDREQESVIVTVAEGKVAVFPARIASALPAQSAMTRTAEVPGRSEAYPNTGFAHAPQASRLVTPGPGSDFLARAIFLTADQQITVGESGTAEPIRKVDSNRALAWAYGRLIFDHESVADAVREFNRYNRIQVRIDDPRLARRSISGVFNASDPNSFVSFIQTVTSVRVTTDDAGNISIGNPE